MRSFSGSGSLSSTVFYTAPSDLVSGWYDVRCRFASTAHAGTPSPGFAPFAELDIKTNGVALNDNSGAFNVSLYADNLDYFCAKQIFLASGDQLTISVARNAGLSSLSWASDVFLARLSDDLV
jgi:hypothetical protein